MTSCSLPAASLVFIPPHSCCTDTANNLLLRPNVESLSQVSCECRYFRRIPIGLALALWLQVRPLDKNTGSSLRVESFFYRAGATNPQRHNGVLLEWGEIRVFKLLTATSTTPKCPLNGC
ncbi:TPA: hypothetical protein ACH3X2_009510 [Trebouxia sp. C0005]